MQIHTNTYKYIQIQIQIQIQIHTNGKAKAVRGHHLSKSVVDCISDAYAFFSVYKITAKSLATKKTKNKRIKQKKNYH